MRLLQEITKVCSRKMKGRTFVVGTILIINSGCSHIEGNFNSKELVSTRGEQVYVNALNWGVTDDYQISAISGNRNKVRERSDTIDIVKGLDPFIYTFQGDTLTLYFDEAVNYKINQQFSTIKIRYVPLNRKAFNDIRTKAVNDEEGYESVPEHIKANYQSDIPLPLPK